MWKWNFKVGIINQEDLHISIFSFVYRKIDAFTDLKVQEKKEESNG